MRGIPRLALLLVALALLAPASSLSATGLKEVKGVVFVEDFEDANLEGWEFGKRAKGEIETQDGNSFLRVVGRSRTLTRIPATDLADFSVEFSTRGGGMHFRDGFKVFFKGGGRDLWFRRPGAMLLRWVRKEYDAERFHKVKVVCLGAIVRLYVDGLMEAEVLDHNPTAAPFFLRGGPCFDDISITADIPSDEGLIALPPDAGANFCEEAYYERQRKSGRISGARVKDRALVFPAAADVKPDIQVLNESRAKAALELELSLDDFEGTLAAKSLRKAFVLNPRIREVVSFNFGKTAPGFYRMNIKLSRRGRALRTTSYPLFVVDLAESVKYRKPVIPVGVFLKWIVWKPLHTKTYWHAIADSLRRHNLNTVVATGGCHREFREIFRRYGISSVVRTLNMTDHPAVIALLNTSMDAERMKALQAGTDKPVTGYFPAEHVGTGLASDPLEAWKKAPPRLRMLRIHPFKRGIYDLTKQPEGETPLARALATAQSSFETPWWALLQASSGSDLPGADADDTTPAQIRAQTHLALAYGARGILYYSFQRGDPRTTGMVDHVTLKPLGDKLKTVSELAALIARHAKLLRSLEFGGTEPRCDNPFIEAVPARNDKDRYVYLVNKNTADTVTCKVFWNSTDKPTQVHDVFAGTAIPAESNQARVSVSLKLAPGEGRLIRR